MNLCSFCSCTIPVLLLYPLSTSHPTSIPQCGPLHSISTAFLSTVCGPFFCELPIRRYSYIRWCNLMRVFCAIKNNLYELFFGIWTYDQQQAQVSPNPHVLILFNDVDLSGWCILFGRNIDPLPRAQKPRMNRRIVAETFSGCSLKS